MSRLFDDASSEYLQRDSAPATAYPLTMACWFYSDNTTAAQVLVNLVDKDSDLYRIQLYASGAAGGDPVAFDINNLGTIRTATTSTGYSANTWHHACGVATSATDRSVFIDGGSEGTNTTSTALANIDRVAIGRNGQATPGAYMSGRIAEAAIWNVALSNAEVALLAKGFSPLFIQPENLVAYWPLVRDDDNDWIGGHDLSVGGTPTVATHPPLVVHPTLPHTQFALSVVTFDAPVGALTLTTLAPTFSFNFVYPLQAHFRDTRLIATERNVTLNAKKRDTKLTARKKL